MLYQAYQTHSDVTQPLRKLAKSALPALNLAVQGPTHATRSSAQYHGATIGPVSKRNVESGTRSCSWAWLARSAEYARPGRTAAGFAYFESFPKTATDFAELAKTQLPMPILSIGGANANGIALGAQANPIASDVTVIVLKDTGHWIMEERQEETVSALARFL